MRLADRLYWIGSGLLGMNATDEFDCNVYLLDGGSAWAIVDCGAGYGVASMLAEAAGDGFRPGNAAFVLLTHAHMDHAGGAAAFLRALPHARLAASGRTAALLEAADEDAIGLTAARAAGVYPPDCALTGCKADLRLRPGDELAVGDLTLRVIGTPGHSSDMIGYYCPELAALFCGDTVFAGGQIAVQTAPDFSMTELAASLFALERLPIERLLPGHHAPLLRDGGLAVRQAANLFRSGQIPPSIV